jgi:hypothetical protein
VGVERSWSWLAAHGGRAISVPVSIDRKVWSRGEQQPSPKPAQLVFVVDIPDLGRAAIARLGRRRGPWWRRVRIERWA